MEPAAPESAFFLTMLVKSAYDVELWVLSQWQMADTDSISWYKWASWACLFLERFLTSMKKQAWGWFLSIPECRFMHPISDRQSCQLFLVHWRWYFSNPCRWHVIGGNGEGASEIQSRVSELECVGLFTQSCFPPKKKSFKGETKSR